MYSQSQVVNIPANPRFHGTASLTRCLCSPLMRGVMLMIRTLLATVLLLSAALSPLKAADTVCDEPDQTFVDLFSRYMELRRNLPITELLLELKKIEKETPTEEKSRRIDEISRKIDMSEILRFETKDHLPGLRACLADTHCRLSALLTTQSWAMKTYSVTRIEREKAYGDDVTYCPVTLHYSGVDGQGIAGHGSATFLSENGEWKIGTQYFSPEGREPNKPLVPTR